MDFRQIIEWSDNGIDIPFHCAVTAYVSQIRWTRIKGTVILETQIYICAYSINLGSVLITFYIMDFKHIIWG